MRSNLAQKLSIARPGEAAKQAGALTDQLQATLVVTCLKAMQWSLVYGDQVSSLLQASTVWAQYESQKHDLFIEDKPVAGYLTSQPQTAGYLTMSHQAMPKSHTQIQTVAGRESRAGRGRRRDNDKCEAICVYSSASGWKLAVVMDLHSVIANSVLRTESKTQPDSFRRLQNLSYRTVCFRNKTSLHCNRSV